MKQSKTKLIAFLCIAANLIMLLQAGIGVIALDDTEILRIVAESEIIGVQLTQGVIFQKNNESEELIALAATPCAGWIPEGWVTVNTGKTMMQVIADNNWSLINHYINSSNEQRYDIKNNSSGEIIGTYHVGHRVDTVPTHNHFHMSGDTINYHYLVN